MSKGFMSRKKKLFEILESDLGKIQRGGVNGHYLLKTLTKKKIMRYTTKQISGLISEVVRFGRENNIKMRGM